MNSDNDTRAAGVPVRVLHTTLGVVNVPGEIVAEHFAIVPELEDDGTPAAFGVQLVHVNTGAWVPVFGWPNRDELRLLGETLAAADLDWANAVPRDWTPEQLDRIYAALEDWKRAKDEAMSELVGGDD